MSSSECDKIAWQLLRAGLTVFSDLNQEGRLKVMLASRVGVFQIAFQKFRHYWRIIRMLLWFQDVRVHHQLIQDPEIWVDPDFGRQLYNDTTIGNNGDVFTKRWLEHKRSE